MAKLRMRQVFYAGLSLALVGWLLLATSGVARAQQATPTATPEVSATPDAGQGIVGGETWAPPTNISRSGAASKQAMVADPNGNLHVLWWDRFAGTFYASYSPATGWTNPVAIPQIIGGRPQVAGDLPIAYDELTLLADNNGLLHAFYRDSRGNVLYSQARADTGAWTGGVQLATSPVYWDATVDSVGNLHLAYIRNIQTDQLPAGVYYRQSSNRGASWENTQAIQTSLYFRALTSANSFLDLNTPGNGQVLVTWDDPRVDQSFTALSTTGGISFDAPVAVGGDQADLPRHTYLFTLANGTLLRLWSPPDSCALFQQISDETLQNWSAPVRVLEDLSGCIIRPHTYLLPDGRLALFAQLVDGDSPLALVLWDGTRWSAPITPRITFVDPATNRSTTLDCLTAVLVGEQVSVAGCDPLDDVWATTSLVTLPELLPAVSTEWSPPTIISLADLNSGLPSLASDSEGRLHALWSQAPLNGSQSTLGYARLEGEAWSLPNSVLASPGGGAAGDPAVTIDQSGHMHALWSGGITGQLYYARAFARDASGAGGWETVRPLTEPDRASASPAMIISPLGALDAVYAVPLNEGRGVYFITSSDQGDSWSTPVQIFDAEAAGWSSVDQTTLAVDTTGRIHVAWVQSSLPPAPTPLNIFYAYSDDDGQTWSEARPMAAGNTGYPTLVASSDDQVHLLWVSNLSDSPQLWHARLPAGTDAWSEPQVVPGLRDIAPRVGIVGDSEGGLHLVGLEHTVSDSTVLFYYNWDGSSWGGRETIPLGYSVDAQSGAHAVIRPQGLLGVVYRVYAPVSGGGRQYLAGYAERPVAQLVIQPAATFTPPPVETVMPSATPSASETPSPTPDLQATPAPASNSGMLVGGTLVGMVVIVVIALIGLRGRRG